MSGEMNGEMSDRHVGWLIVLCGLLATLVLLGGFTACAYNAENTRRHVTDQQRTCVMNGGSWSMATASRPVV